MYKTDTDSPFTGLSYLVNHNFIAYVNLPSYYRYIENFKILQSVSEANQIFWNNVFLNNRDDLNIEAQVFGSRMCLEAFLNSLFDITNKGIEIVNSQQVLNQIILYNKQEAQSTSFEDTYLFNKSEIIDDSLKTYLYNQPELGNNWDFAVYVPISVINNGFTISQIRAVVDTYSELGNIYEVIII